MSARFSYPLAVMANFEVVRYTVEPVEGDDQIAIVLVRFTGVKDYLTAEGLGRFLAAAGLWAPVVYMLIYVIGVCLFVPGAILTGLGAVIFGPYWGFVYVWIGAMIMVIGSVVFIMPRYASAREVA